MSSSHYEFEADLLLLCFPMTRTSPESRSHSPDERHQGSRVETSGTEEQYEPGDWQETNEAGDTRIHAAVPLASSADDPAKREKLKKIKEKVESGDYDVSASEVAEKIIEGMLRK